MTYACVSVLYRFIVAIRKIRPCRIAYETMAYDLKNEEDVKEYLKNLHIEYQFGCYSEKKPEGECEDAFRAEPNLDVKIAFYSVNSLPPIR